ncbi:MAG TPA: tyrosine-type recombinase/integrase [Ktedonobacterales bacterium]|nr:tyrosine-type recombinase/integrase [Ktedonobacterales bacterium]
MRITLAYTPQTGCTCGKPKTKRSRRRVALSDVAVMALRAQRRRQFGARLLVGEAWQGERWGDLVFPDALGGPMQGTGIYHNRGLRCCRRWGLPRVRFHDLRHTFATLPLCTRVNPKVVSEALGHGSVAITLGVYSHVILDMQQDAAVALDAILLRTPEGDDGENRG